MPPMLAKLTTFSLVGIEALPVEVEVDVSPAGLPRTVLAGTHEPRWLPKQGPVAAEELPDSQ
jgi:hypothetical protein